VKGRTYRAGDLPRPPSRSTTGAGSLGWSRVRPAISPGRIPDAIPGGLAWLALLSVVVTACYAPAILVFGVALLTAYTAVRFAFAAVAALWGLYLVRRWANTNWRAEYARRATEDSLPVDSVHHLVVIPSYHEEPAILRRTLDRLAGQTSTRTRISVVLAMEAAEPGSAEKGARLKAEYGAAFENVFVTVHPQNIPGETRCKSANQSWAVRWARQVMVDELGISADHIVVTGMDADTLWHPAYFECLSVLFAVDPRRYATYWQAPIRYHANVWEIHPLMRLLHAYSSAWELAYLAAPWWQGLPMSSYSLSLHLLESAGYWDTDVIADEWHMYLKSYFRRDGDQRLKPVFLPFLANATTGTTIWQAIQERYRQTFRHAWGAKEIGYTITQMAHCPKARRRRASLLLLRVAHDNLLAGAGWVVMFLGSQLPPLLHPLWARTALTSPPFVLFQVSILTVTALTILFWVLDLRLRPARAAPWRAGDRWYELISLPLIAVLTVLCVALPVLHAQTRLMLGRSIQFRVSPKT
jgi:hypothetical protein